MPRETTTDRLFDALADVHRRRLLFALADHEPQPITDLAGVPWSIPESEIDMLTKHHVHLPKLVDYGFIEWDRGAEVVFKGPRFDDIEPVLECLEKNRDELPLALA